MSSFTYPVSEYFANGVSLSQLQTEITNTLSLSSLQSISEANGQLTFTFSDTVVENNLITVLENHDPTTIPFYLCYAAQSNWTIGNLLNYLAAYGAISLNLDTYAFIGFGIIPDIPTINTAIANYVEPPVITPVTLSISSASNFIQASVGDIMKSQNPQEFFVAQNGRANYSTIASAVAGISPGVYTIIRIYPGTYVESNPIILPANCTLIGEGGAANTIIVAVNNTSPLLQIGNSNLIAGFTFVGGSYGIQHDGSTETVFSLIQNCIFSGTGAYVYNGLGSCLISKASFSGAQTAITCSGGSLIANDIEILGNQSSYTPNGIVVTNGGLATIDVFSVYYCTNAIQINNDSEIKSTLINIESCGNGIVVVANTGTYTGLSTLVIGTLNIEESTTFDVSISAPVVNKILTASFDDGKIYNPGQVVINSNIQNYKNNWPYQVLCGNIQVGTEVIPSALAIGTNVNQNNMDALLYDGTNYVDESANFRIVGNPPVTLTNQSIYLSHKTLVTYGFDIYSNLSTNPSISYWNGTAWTAVNFSLYDITSDAFVSQITSSCSVYLDQTYSPQQIAVNGITAYWIQIVPVNCTIQTIQLHSSIKNFVAKGSSRNYGAARKQVLLQIPVNIINNTIYFSLPASYDYSCPYTITVYADSGITLNGQLYSATVASAAVYGSATNPQSFTISATNIKCISVSYYSL